MELSECFDCISVFVSSAFQCMARPRSSELYQYSDGAGAGLITFFTSSDPA